MHFWRETKFYKKIIKSSICMIPVAVIFMIRWDKKHETTFLIAISDFFPNIPENPKSQDFYPAILVKIYLGRVSFVLPNIDCLRSQNLIFRQPAASIYGFVHYVYYITFVQNFFRTLLSKVGGWNLVCWLFSHGRSTKVLYHVSSIMHCR